MQKMQEMKSDHSLNEKSMKCRSVEIKRPHQCGLVAYHLAKLKMTEFYCDVLDTFKENFLNQLQRKLFRWLQVKNLMIMLKKR